MNKEKKFKKSKQPWPTKAAMEQVYNMNLWGGDDNEFYSGEGSHDVNIVKPYINTVVEFLNSFQIPIIVCDLGCGDFNIGKNLVQYSKKYIAVDIVDSLIEYNQKKFINDNLEFQCLDIATDKLPKGDCAIVRQVLQHLSNSEVHKVVEKLYNYKYVILTEHLPAGEFEPNIDIISGQGIRIKKKSGLSLLEAPFYFKIIETQELLKVNLKEDKGVIVTTLFRVF